jgi:hypothetical protein
MPSIYQLTPSLYMINALRIDSAVSNFHEQYGNDCKFFEKHRSRRIHIRQAAPGELDLDMPLGQWLQAPKLWLSITKLSEGIHQATPVYRGKQFWTEPKTDADAALMLIDMGQRQGIDLPEWRAFENRIVAENQVRMVATNKDNQVH